MLNSFRSAGDVWAEAKEYSILFTIWKQMYKEATDSISIDAADIVLDVVNVDELPGNSSDQLKRGDEAIWVSEGKRKCKHSSQTLTHLYL